MRITPATNYSQPTFIRYAAIAAVVLGIVALIGYIWTRPRRDPTPNPIPPPPTPPPPPPPPPGKGRKRAQSIPPGFSPATFKRIRKQDAPPKSPNTPKFPEFNLTSDDYGRAAHSPTPLRPNRPVNNPAYILDTLVKRCDCEELRNLAECSIEEIRKLSKKLTNNDRVIETLLQNEAVKQVIAAREEDKTRSLKATFLNRNNIDYSKLRNLEILLTPKMVQLRQKIKNELSQKGITDSRKIDEAVIESLAQNSEIRRTIDEIEEKVNAAKLMKCVRKKGANAIGGVNVYNRDTPTSTPRRCIDHRPMTVQIVRRQVEKLGRTDQSINILSELTPILEARRRRIESPEDDT